MNLIYHMTTQPEWDEAVKLGEYRARSLATEGFIHASTKDQLEASANRHFARNASIVLLKIDLDLVRGRVVWENSPHSATPFPHLYGPLILDAVMGIFVWERDGDGRFRRSISAS